MVYNILKNPSDLKPHKVNTDIYGAEIVDADLVESIKQKGILEPLVILEDNTILSGHRRWLAAKELKLERIPCRSMSFSDELDEKEALIEFNRQRKKNYSQLMNEADMIESIESERNKIKMIEASHPKGKHDVVPMTSEEQVRKKIDNETTTKVAKKIGVSRDRLIKNKKVWDYAKTGDTYAKSLVDKLDKEDVSANEAAKRIKVYQEAPEPMKRKIVKDDMSSKEILAAIKKEEKKKQVEEKQIEKKIELTQPADIMDKKYNVILADPPWRYDFQMSKSRMIENHYPTMEVDDICKLNVPADNDSILFLWATSPKLLEAIKVMQAWGFTYKTNAVWDKTKIGQGYYFRGQHELLLIGTKGNISPPLPENRRSSVISISRTTHSKKPECVYDMIEKMYPHGVYLELFARNKHSDQWDVWGNEV